MTHAYTKSKKICYKRKRNFHTFLNEKMEKIKIRLQLQNNYFPSREEQIAFKSSGLYNVPQLF